MEEVITLIQQRDQDFLNRFCDAGAYMDEEGKHIIGVCKTVSANEVLTFLHQYDEMFLTIKK